MFTDSLPEGITLQLWMYPNGADNVSGKIIFSSSKKWLHPLFELEEFLQAHPQSGSLVLRDRIIGRAAAFLILRMGIRRVETDLVSRLALSLLQEPVIEVKASKTIDAINCITEKILKDIYDPAVAAAILAERRIKALAKISNGR